jgi:hypothetical protein
LEHRNVSQEKDEIIFFFMGGGEEGATEQVKSPRFPNGIMTERKTFASLVQFVLSSSMQPISDKLWREVSFLR